MYLVLLFSANNRLSGEIPAEFRKLIALEKVYLSEFTKKEFALCGHAITLTFITLNDIRCYSKQ
jgi:hypothetical protein